ncbi:hypothetical protein FAP94_03165 [Morganella morganii]|nr:hypothetical protein [Morganella morganii]
MHLTSLGAAREIQEGIAVDPLLVGCGVKPHDFDLPRPIGRKTHITTAITLPIQTPNKPALLSGVG